MRLQRRSTPIGGLELVSLPVRSAALLGLSGERRRAHGSLRVPPRSGASRRRRARLQDSTAPRLGSSAPRTPRPRAASFPWRRLAGPAASHSPRSSHCPRLGTPLLVDDGHSGTRCGLRATLPASRLASPLAVARWSSLSPPGTTAAIGRGERRPRAFADANGRQKVDSARSPTTVGARVVNTLPYI